MFIILAALRKIVRLHKFNFLFFTSQYWVRHTLSLLNRNIGLTSDNGWQKPHHISLIVGRLLSDLPSSSKRFDVMQGKKPNFTRYKGLVHEDIVAVFTSQWPWRIHDMIYTVKTLYCGLDMLCKHFHWMLLLLLCSALAWFISVRLRCPVHI